jgi:hypothetical protein
LPQQSTAPLVVRAHAKRTPATTCAASSTPATSTGSRLSKVEVPPSWPLVPEPQQRTRPLFIRAQVKLSPVASSSVSVAGGTRGVAPPLPQLSVPPQPFETTPFVTPACAQVSGWQSEQKLPISTPPHA